MSHYSDDQKRAIERISQALPFRLSRLNVHLNTQATRALASASDLSLNQWRVFFLIHHLQPVTSKTLSSLSAIDPAVISRCAHSLLDQGILRLERNEEDQRERLMSLTDDGKALMESLGPIMDARREKLDQVLTREENQILNRIISKLEAQALEQDF